MVIEPFSLISIISHNSYPLERSAIDAVTRWLRRWPRAECVARKRALELVEDMVGLNTMDPVDVGVVRSRYLSFNFAVVRHIFFHTK